MSRLIDELEIVNSILQGLRVIEIGDHRIQFIPCQEIARAATRGLAVSGLPHGLAIFDSNHLFDRFSFLHRHTIYQGLLILRAKKLTVLKETSCAPFS